MRFCFVYKIGNAPEETDSEDFPTAESAKDFARQSLRINLTMSLAETGSVSVGQVEGPRPGDIKWLGSYDLERGADPVWSAED